MGVCEVADPDAALGELVERFRVSRTVRPSGRGVHDDHVAVTGVVEHRAQAGPVGARTGLLVEVDPFGGDAGFGERVDLAFEVLLASRNARVPEIHLLGVVHLLGPASRLMGRS